MDSPSHVFFTTTKSISSAWVFRLLNAAKRDRAVEHRTKCSYDAVLDAGAMLGPFKILSAIGKVGMSEVYRARDTRLNRTVAVKISATEFCERCAGEARAIAALDSLRLTRREFSTAVSSLRTFCSPTLPRLYP